MTELELRNTVANIMNEWKAAGLKESDGSHMKIVNIYNSHKPLARNYKVKQKDSWCATTVSAAFIEAENRTGIKFTSIIGTECSCQRQIELMKKLKSWQENDAYVPKVADIIYYDWDDNGVGDDTGWSDHVGLVVSISKNNMTVVEGNKADKVGSRKISVNAKNIRGFGVPNFAKLATQTSVTPKPVVTPTPAKPTTTTKPATTTTTTKPATSTTYKAVVTPAAGLNVRLGPGTGNEKVKALKKGTTVTVYEEKNGWSRIGTDQWVCSKYIKKV